MRRVFVSDCEGPISKNDNAFELTTHFVPSGDRLFTMVSRYDDVLVDIVRKSNYQAGSTLKLVLPFLKAYDAKDRQMETFSRRSLVLVSNARDTLQYVRSLGSVFMVSTSYEHYVKALCQATGFPFKNTYCTRVSIDKYPIDEEEKRELHLLAKEISQMPMFDILPSASSLKDLPTKAQTTIARLDAIFWKQIAIMQIGRIFSDVTTVGGKGKAKAIEDILQKKGATLDEVMYVGDSITDVEALRLVKDGGGLALSFNGNEYAVENAEVAILSEYSIVTAIVADVFLRFGKPDAIDLVRDWSRRALQRHSVDKSLLVLLFRAYPGRLPRVKIVTDRNTKILGKESCRFRKKVRGEAIGRLG